MVLVGRNVGRRALEIGVKGGALIWGLGVVGIHAPPPPRESKKLEGGSRPPPSPRDFGALICPPRPEAKSARAGVARALLIECMLQLQMQLQL